ncbi:hypothetical protein [Spongiactinospora sp. 9N601]|uniref:hypothetical protein n=1 Tax=Spongiactinospora sp. 9N601 TaxID=3375149 RepID=UPI0037B9B95C
MVTATPAPRRRWSPRMWCGSRSRKARSVRAGAREAEVTTLSVQDDPPATSI